jgi:Nuclease-related domain
MPKPSKDQKRSPLDRSMPMRAAGQSLSDEIDNVKGEKLLEPLLIAAMTFVMAGMEWLRYFTNAKPSPYIFTAIFVLAIAYLFYKIPKLKSEVTQLKLGRDGERVVAHYVEELRAYGFTVFHDVPSGDANVDHIIIGTKGIFTIETKTMQKPLRGACKVNIANGVIYANGSALPRNPLTQARAQANWLKNFLAESKFNVPVWPVVAFPGWFVDQDGVKAENAWVIEPKQLQPKIERQSERYSPEQVSAMVSALRSYIRVQIEK